MPSYVGTLVLLYASVVLLLFLLSNSSLLVCVMCLLCPFCSMCRALVLFPNLYSSLIRWLCCSIFWLVSFGNRCIVWSASRYCHCHCCCHWFVSSLSFFLYIYIYISICHSSLSHVVCFFINVFCD